MSNSTHWRDQIVTIDDRGREALRSAAVLAINSLQRPLLGPRSQLSPQQVREFIWSRAICTEDGEDLASVLEDFGENVWANSVIPSDPFAVAHLHPPTLLPSVVTDLTVSASNQTMDSWDQSPAATEVELHLMSWLANMIGFSTTGSGVMTSGGTASNVLAMTLARSKAAAQSGHDVLRAGLPSSANRWRILCSDQAHFSIQRAAAQLGLGRDAVILVPTNASGAMDLAALDVTRGDIKSDGLEIIAIVGTAGTTDIGAVDPLGDIALRAREDGAWFHVDAAVAGAFLLSNNLRTQLDGLSSADSVTIDFHKLWWQPFNARALVLRDQADFDLLRVTSDYLDRGDELEGMINLVGRSLDTSRRFDAAKVVATLRTLGRVALGEMVDRVVEITNYAASSIEADPVLYLVAPSSSVMCVFSARGAREDDLRRVQQQLLARGEMVLGRTIIKGQPALKFTFMNPLSSESDVDKLIVSVVKELAL